MSRTYHYWTTTELKDLLLKPSNVSWRRWIKRIGLKGIVNYKAALERYSRELKERIAAYAPSNTIEQPTYQKGEIIEP